MQNAITLPVGRPGDAFGLQNLSLSPLLVFCPTGAKIGSVLSQQSAMFKRVTASTDSVLWIMTPSGTP